MIARTHDLAAITLLGVVFLSQPGRPLRLSTVILALLANLIGGITPDIDQPTAPFWRNLPVGKYFGRVFKSVSGGHRFITHSIAGLFIFGFLAHWLLIFFKPVMGQVNIGYIWWAYMLGMLSHLIMDSFTKEGVPWLLPLPFKFGFPPLRRLRLTTDKAVEKFIVFPGLLIFNGLWFNLHYQQLLAILRQISNAR